MLIVNGHPDPRPERFCAALCAACLDGARADGRRAIAIALGALPAEDGQQSGRACAERVRAFDLVHRSRRLTVIFPLWLGKPPPALTQFFEDAAREDAVDRRIDPTRRSVHMVVTMAMPAFAYRAISRAKGNRPQSQDLVTLPGVVTSKMSFIGSVDTISRGRREGWLDALRRPGMRGT